MNYICYRNVKNTIKYHTNYSKNMFQRLILLKIVQSFIEQFSFVSFSLF